MNIDSTAILAAFGVLATVISILWSRSERCLSDRTNQAKQIAKIQRRFTSLVAKLSSCPVEGCPFREWSHDELDEEEDEDKDDNHTGTPDRRRPLPSHFAVQSQKPT